MRTLFAKLITSFAKNDERVVLLSGDIGNKMFDEFKKTAPKRFINCGIAEANMISLASGLAMCGLKPFVYTITPFITTRCLEQIKIGIAYHQSNVVIVGTGSGLSYAELGPTHHSLEDIAILKAIPNIRILTPADPMELKSHLNEVLFSDIPTYIRLGKKGEPNLHTREDNLGIGKANIVLDGDQFLILSIGPIINEAINAAEKLREEGISVAVASMSSIRPLDKHFLLKMLDKRYQKWITLEEHSLVGGLGSSILEWLSENNLFDSIKVERLGAKSEFIHKLGNQSYVRSMLGLNSLSIIDFIKRK